MSSRLFLLVCSLVTAVLLASCSGGGNDDPIAIKVGIVQSLSGDGALYGKSAVEGMELAIEEVNEDGDVEIEYVVVDDKSSVNDSLAAYRSLKDQGVDVILGPTYSTIAQQVLKYADENSIPAIAPITTGSGLGAIGDYVFRIALAEDASLPHLVERVNEESKIGTAALVFDSSDVYSRTAAEAFRKGVRDVGGTISREIDIASSPDWSETFSDQAVASSDAILLPLLLNGTTADILKAIKAAGYTKPLLGGEAITTEGLAQLAGDAVNGLYVASSWHPAATDQMSKDFVAAYRAKFGHEPEHYAASSYTAIYVLEEAVKKAKNTQAADLQRELANVEIDSVLGELTMSDEGDAVFEPVVQRFENGKLVLLPDR